MRFQSWLPTLIILLMAVGCRQPRPPSPFDLTSTAIFLRNAILVQQATQTAIVTLSATPLPTVNLTETSPTPSPDVGLTATALPTGTSGPPPTVAIEPRSLTATALSNLLQATPTFAQTSPAPSHTATPESLSPYQMAQRIFNTDMTLTATHASPTPTPHVEHTVQAQLTAFMEATHQQQQHQTLMPVPLSPIPISPPQPTSTQE